MPSAVPKASVPPLRVAFVLVLLLIAAPTVLPLTVPCPTSTAPLPTVRVKAPLTVGLAVELPSVSRISELTVRWPPASGRPDRSG